MGYENPIHTLGDYFKPSQEGYMDTIKLPIGNNVDFLKLVDSLDLDGENMERTRLRLFQLSLRDQASNWLEHLPAGSITTWEDLTTRFLAQFFPSGRTAKLRNDILIGPRSSYETKVVNDLKGFTTSQGKLHRPQDIPDNIRPWSPRHSVLHGDPEQTFVEYASLRTDEVGGKWYTFKPEQNNLGDTDNPSWRSHPNLSLRQPEIEPKPPKPKEPKPTLEDEFQDLHLNLPVLEVLAQAPIYNAILDKYVESLELGKNGSAFVQGEIPVRMKNPRLFTLPCRLGDLKPFDTLADLGSCVNIIPLYLLKKLNIELLEKTDHIFGLADGTKSYPVGIVKDVEVHIGKLKLLNDFYVFDMKKDPKTPLPVGREFLATANAVIDCRMAKIAVGEGITRSVNGVKGVDLGEEPPIKPPSLNSFRMKEVDHLTIHTPPSPHVASFHHKDMYFYYHSYIGDPKKYYGFKLGLLGQDRSLGVDLLNWEMIEDDWQLEPKEVSFLGRRLNLPVRPNELENVRIKETHHLEHIIQQQKFQHVRLIRRSLEVLKEVSLDDSWRTI
ncbi:MAK10-like protein [Tanacetum coccineum]